MDGETTFGAHIKKPKNFGAHVEKHKKLRDLETRESHLCSADPLQLAKNLFVSFFEWFGELGFFVGRMFRAAVTPPYEGRELIRQLDEIGSKSLLLIALAGSAIGVVLSL